MNHLRFLTTFLIIPTAFLLTACSSDLNKQLLGSWTTEKYGSIWCLQFFQSKNESSDIAGEVASILYRGESPRQDGGTNPKSILSLAGVWGTTVGNRLWMQLAIAHEPDGKEIPMAERIPYTHDWYLIKNIKGNTLNFKSAKKDAWYTAHKVTNCPKEFFTFPAISDSAADSKT